MEAYKDVELSVGYSCISTNKELNSIKFIKNTLKNLIYKYMKNYINFIKFLNEKEDYVGMHGAPTKEDAPMYNLKDVYPDDIYSYDAARLYGDNGGDSLDRECISIIQSAKDKPNKLIKIYRAVPDLNKDINKQIKDLLYIHNYHFKFGFFPMNNKLVDKLTDKYDTVKNISYDEYQKMILFDIKKQIEELNKNKQKSIGINNGDWVTIVRNYAKEHGQSNLNNNYKIISKTVRASQLYTDGNSLFEWGYNI